MCLWVGSFCKDDVWIIQWTNVMKKRKQKHTGGEMMEITETETLKRKIWKDIMWHCWQIWKRQWKKAIFWEKENREVSLCDRIKSRKSQVPPSVSAQKHPGQGDFPNQLSKARRPHPPVFPFSPTALYTIWYDICLIAFTCFPSFLPTGIGASWEERMFFYLNFLFWHNCVFLIKSFILISS